MCTVNTPFVTIGAPEMIIGAPEMIIGAPIAVKAAQSIVFCAAFSTSGGQIGASGAPIR